MNIRILIRHGQSQFNLGETFNMDSDITERGSYQVQEVALALKELLDTMLVGTTFDVCFVSPYVRALKTALPIYSRLKIKTIIEPRIGEVPEERKKEQKTIIPFRQSDFPAYEWGEYPKDGLDVSTRSISDYYAELKIFIKQLPKNAVIISHCTTIKDLAGLMTSQSLRNIDIPNCSMTLIEDNELIFMGKR